VHAVIVRVTIKDQETAEKALREQVVPSVSQAPGFVGGYWTRKDDTGMSMLVFESEEAATAMSERVESPDDDAVTMDSVEVREVVANA
jgi:heme-degrading monooxygenase HmoA